MGQSILDSVKKIIGYSPEDDSFDIDIIMHINSTFFTLQQLGVGPDFGYEITGREETWEDFVDDSPNLNAVKSYVAIKVRMTFDPPANAFVLDGLKAQATEYEWRLNIQAETKSADPTKVITWTLPEGDPFPAEAKIGDIGYDPTTGKLWRYTDG